MDEAVLGASMGLTCQVKVSIISIQTQRQVTDSLHRTTDRPPAQSLPSLPQS